MSEPFQFSIRRMLGAMAALGAAAWLIRPFTGSPRTVDILLAIFGLPACIGATIGFLVGAPLRWTIGCALVLVPVLVAMFFIRLHKIPPQPMPQHSRDARALLIK
jgi:hypothetical protein